LAGAGLTGLVGMLFWLRGGAESQAQTPLANRSGPPMQAGAPPAVSEEYARRVVAYIFGNVPITREMLGEYLIARFGADNLELLVNKLIIEEVCKAQNITVTPPEIEAELAESVAGLGVSQNEFVERLLRIYKTTLPRWKEDAIRPKLMLSKLVQNKVTCTEEDLTKAYEAFYGEKVEGRIILWPPDEQQLARKAYPQIRDSEPAFADAAKKQASQMLASKGGKVDLVGRFTTGNKELEDAIFALQPGEITTVQQVPEGWVVFKCDGRIPAKTSVNPQAVREQLIKEVIAKKTKMEIQKAFVAMREQARPQILLEGAKKQIDIAGDTQKLLPPDMGGSANYGAMQKGH
jgi:hypothetical protein